MLPSKVPEATIYTFNYNSSWYFNAPAQRLLPLAETLLAQLSTLCQPVGLSSQNLCKAKLIGRPGRSSSQVIHLHCL